MHFFGFDIHNHFWNIFQRVVRFTCKIYCRSVNLQCNLPGWRWATITKVALDRLSRSLHSDVCDSDGLRDAAIHSTISGSGGRRDCATSNKGITKSSHLKVLLHASHFAPIATPCNYSAQKGSGAGLTDDAPRKGKSTSAKNGSAKLLKMKRFKMKEIWNFKNWSTGAGLHFTIRAGRKGCRGP